MRWQRKISGGILATIGFLLSPLSWWNDLLVNVPLALFFGWMVSLIYRPAFEVSVIIGYWLTNIIGLVLLQKGAEQALSDEVRPYTRRKFIRDIAISLVYTGLIVVLLKWQVLKPFDSYFHDL